MRSKEILNELKNLYDAGYTIKRAIDIPVINKLVIFQSLQAQIDPLEIEFFTLKRDEMATGETRVIFADSLVFHKTLAELKESILHTHSKYGNSYRAYPKIPNHVEDGYQGLLYMELSMSGRLHERYDPINLRESNPDKILGMINKCNLYSGHIHYDYSQDDDLVEWLYTECFNGHRQIYEINAGTINKLVLMVE